ncbi:beta-ketoacyl-[acyl-carrier-protein] synthase family protein [bacterium]|nr:beta-ketoacyl-[acyl-carrier-protein] synthase family protein [bacterium]
MKKRVVITGLGTVNSIAQNIPDFVQALKKGICGIGPVNVFDTTGFRTKTGGEVRNFRPRAMIPRSFSLKRMSRSDRMALAASLEALRDAKLFPIPTEYLPEVGVIIGGGAGGMLEGEAVYQAHLNNEPKQLRFSAYSSFCCASSADHISAKLGILGPKTTIMTACSSGATALGYAKDLIQDGAAKIIITGGTEPLSRITYGAFNALKAVDPEYCKPFAANRQGMSLGEGSGIMILEDLEFAKQRNAPIYGEILGYGISCDSHHMTAPDPQASGAVRCMQAALKDANVDRAEIDYINAHGTATPANDVTETKAIKAVFGDRAYKIPVSSTKSMTGHTLGAAGAIEAVACITAITESFIPPTIHHSEPDPDCDLDYVSSGSRDQELQIVMSNSFAFGGNNTSLVLGKFTK